MLNPATDRLVLDVRTAKGETFRGVVGSAEIEGGSALLLSEFRRHDAPSIVIGEDVELTLPRLHEGEQITFRARASVRNEDRVRVCYHFEVGQALGWVVSKFSDRRLATRVRPYADAPIRASVQHEEGGPRFPAAVKDISATGVNLLVPVEHEARLFTAWNLRVWLQVPLDKGPVMEMVGRVCSRRGDGGAVCYGVDFDVEATEDFASKQDAIQEYVVSCQAAALYLFRHRKRRLQSEILRSGTEVSIEHLDPFSLDEGLGEDDLQPVRELDQLAAIWRDLAPATRQALLVLAEGLHEGTAGRSRASA